MVKALLINPNDNVAVALSYLAANSEVTILNGASRTQMKALRNISFAHKIAVRAIKEGDTVLKFGIPIAVATRDIAAGEWVHLHNARSCLQSATAVNA